MIAWRQIVIRWTNDDHDLWSSIASLDHDELTHWDRVTHICVGNLTIIGSDNGLSPGRHQAIIWTNVGMLLIGPLGTNFSEMLIKIHTFSFKKIHLKTSSAKWRLFCLGLNELTLLPENKIDLEYVNSSYDKVTIKPSQWGGINIIENTQQRLLTDWGLMFSVMKYYKCNISFEGVARNIPLHGFAFLHSSH